MTVNKKLIALVLFTSLITSCGSNTTSSSIDNNDSSNNVANANVEVTTTTSQQELSTGYIITNGEDFAQLYQENVEGTPIARMYQGEPITVYSINGEWANISYGGFTGYVKISNVSFNKPEETEKETTTQQQTQAQTQATTVQDTPKNENENNVVVAQNIEQSVNMVFLSDSDGFQYAKPNSYPEYVSDSGEIAWCSAKSIYIHSEPSADSPKREADMLYYGDVCTILGSVGSWYYIGTDSGSGYTLHGYVKKSYITKGATPKDPEPVNASQGRVKKNSANVRSSPDKSTDSNVLFTLHQGDTFTILDYVNNYWYYIDYNGTRCYISHKMVEVW